MFTKPLIAPLLSKISRKASLRLILAFFVLQLPSVVGVTGFLSFRNGQQAVNDLADQLTTEVGDHVEQKLKAYVEVPQLVTRINADAVRFQGLDLTDLVGLQSYLSYRFRQFNDFQFNNPSFLSIATETGDYIGLGYRPPRRFVMDIRDMRTSPKTWVWRLNDWGDRTRPFQILSNYEPREQPWYRRAIEVGKLVWVDPYIAISGEDLLLSVDRPLFSRQGKLLGVTSAALSLLDISKFLQRLKIGKTGQAFIVEPNGLLVGTSTSEPIFFSKRQNHRLHARNSQSLLTREITTQLETQFGNFNNINSPKELQLRTSDNQLQFVKLRPFRDNQGLSWLVVVVIPEADFMDRIHANNRTTLLLCLGALGLAIAAATIISRWIARPLLELTQAAEALTQENWDYPITIQRPEELGLLSSTFKRMRQDLRQSQQKLGEYAAGLEQKNEKLRTLESELRQQLNLFLNAVSHDLRNPVIGTSMVLENLNRQPGNEVPLSRLVLCRMIESNQRQLELINSLIDTHAAEIWGISLHPQATSLGKLAEGAIADLQPLLERENITLHNRIPADLPLAKLDTLQMGRVYQNLVSNALKHNPPGLTLVLDAQQQEDSIRCTVQDNGLGIPPEQCDKLFNPY
ncbi:MAG: HAMP domain-containing protein, partial [Oculatellaceae cyanobacterium Prado106]|nr:HAMP domain-containing protein [Oculatellaceae cyanobacterium Prado106]